MKLTGMTRLVAFPLLLVLLAACVDSNLGEVSGLGSMQDVPLAEIGEASQLRASTITTQDQAMKKSTTLDEVDLSRLDDQGAVEVVVRPRNLLSAAGGLIEFDIYMNTHSVDLSMDLAALSTLETDLGLYVAAGWWSGGSGHHVQGVLTFPERDEAGRTILEGARTVTLRIEGVDAPVREFYWEVSPDA